MPKKKAVAKKETIVKPVYWGQSPDDYFLESTRKPLKLTANRRD